MKGSCAMMNLTDPLYQKKRNEANVKFEGNLGDLKGE